MDVKDVKSLAAKTAKIQQTSESVKPSQLQRNGSQLSASTVNATRADSVNVKVEGRAGSKSEDVIKSRERANSLINVVNFAAEATEEIDKLVRSVDGIIEQASSESITPERTQVLESEANELINEIRRQANLEGPDGSRPLAGDKVRVDLEEKLGKTLEVILPEAAKDAFGIGTVQFSTKDSILQTRTQVEEARLRLDSLKNAVSQVQRDVSESVAELEVAFQNSEAAAATIRDVEGALEKGNEVRSAIKLNPDDALSSVGEFQKGRTEQLLS